MTHRKADDHVEQEMTRSRHVELHRGLDELIACFIADTGRLPSETTLMELMIWSNEQTTAPSCAQKK